MSDLNPPHDDDVDLPESTEERLREDTLGPSAEPPPDDPGGSPLGRTPPPPD